MLPVRRWGFEPPSLFAGGLFPPAWLPLVIRVGLPLLLFLCDTFPTRMTRRSSKKPFHSQRNSLKLPPELQSEEREIREFLSGAGKPPELPNGGVVVTQVHPTVLREYWRREMAAIHRCRKFWADQKQSRESEQQ